MLLVVVLDWTDGPTAVFAVAWLASLGAIAFAVAAGARTTLRVSIVLSVLVAIFVAGHTALVWRQFPVLRILYVKGQFEARPLYEKWNSYSRVRVNGNPGELTEAYGWGLSPKLPPDRKYAQLKMDIDVSAGTVLTKYSGKPDEVDHLAYDITNIGYTIRPGAKALVVGTGGGRDVLSALTFGASHVTGVEINKAIIDTLNVRFGDFTGHLDRDPRVRFVVDEARSFIARQRRTATTSCRSPSSIRGPPRRPGRSCSARTRSTRSRRGGPSSATSRRAASSACPAGTTRRGRARSTG